MNAPQVGRLIECLKSARKRSAMYLGAVEVDAAIHFLNGLNRAVKTCTFTALAVAPPP